MTLTLNEVKHIADLARLELNDEEISRYREQLSDILEYAARLQTIDTTSIPPTSSVLPSRSVLRSDQVEQSLNIKEVLGNAPETEKNQFKVPPVFE